METAAVDNLVEGIRDDVVRWRRHLHRNPELSHEEFETSRFVYETLRSFGGLLLERPTPTSVVTRLVGERAGRVPGRTVAIRADMDALPIREENGFGFASQNPGVIHACGHDGHTAVLLGTARALSGMRGEIPGEVRFVFQHAEEVPHGGAEELVRAGVLDGVDTIVGLHLSSSIDTGGISVVYGPASGAVDTFDIVVEGEGGHAAWPQKTVDPVAIGAQIVTNLQHLVSRGTDAREAAVVSVTRFAGGTTHNVIPNTATLAGTVRTLNEEVRKRVPETMERIVRGITEAHGASYSFAYERGPGSVVNDHEVTTVVEETARDLFGEAAVEVGRPTMGGEDFSAYQRVVPGCFFSLGARNEEEGITYPHHHPRFTIDEDALETGVKMFVHTALRLLEVGA